MKVLLLFLSIFLCQCTATSRRSGDNKPNNANQNDAANTAFWAARGKRTELPGYGVLRCGWMRSSDEMEDEFNWPRLDSYESFPDTSLETRFKRSTGFPFRENGLDFPSQVPQLPSWWLRPSSHGNAELLHRELAWLKLMGKRSTEKDSGSSSGTGGTVDVPFWAARG